MDVLQSLIDQALVLVREAPAALSLLVLSLSALLEYVLPMLPGDTFALVGGILVGQNALPLIGVLIALTAGSVVGSLMAYGIGRVAAEQPWARKRLERFLPADRLQAIEQTFAKYGRWALVANRFIPGLRAAFLFGAGLGRMRPIDVVVFGGISALAWNTALVGAGVVVGENLPVLIGIVRQYTYAAYAVCGVAGVGFILYRLTRPVKSNNAPDEPQGDRVSRHDEGAVQRRDTSASSTSTD